MFGGFGSLAAGGVTMAQVAQTLSQSQRLNRVVVDKTGLQGLYEFNLEFTPEQLPPPGTLLNGQAPQIDPNGPSLFTALQEQLGLKLDAQRGPVEMLVIDSVEPRRPTDACARSPPPSRPRCSPSGPPRRRVSRSPRPASRRPTPRTCERPSQRRR